MAPPNAVFYPSCIINFRFRFDNAFVGVADPPSTSPIDQSANPGPIGQPAAEPDAIKGQADDLSQILGIVPKKCSVELPGYRQAGKFSIEMDFRDFPIDPRAVRACAVEIYLDAVAESDFATGMEQTVPPNPALVSARPRRSILVPSSDNLVIVGVVDDIATEYGEDGSYVHLEGRDLRGILLDLKTRPEMFQGAPGSKYAPLDFTQPIDQVVLQIIDRCPFFATGQRPDVVVFNNDWDGGLPLAPADAQGLTRARQTAAGGSASAYPGAEPTGMSFWDLITQMCFFCGAVPYFYGQELRIRPARSLFDIQQQEDSRNPGTFQTPFADGAPRSAEVANSAGQVATQTLKHRIMVYGKNCRELKFERKLAGLKVPVIEVVSVDTSNPGRGYQNRFISVLYPDPSDLQSNNLPQAGVTSVFPSGSGGQTDVVRVKVAGIADKDRLRTIAKSIREEIGRQEIGGSCSTFDLASFGGGNSDPDLLRLRPGDPVEFRIAINGPQSNPPFASELMRNASLPNGALAKAIADRIGDATVAKVIANTLTGSVPQFQSTFRTSTAKFVWSEESVAIDFDFQNYVEARYDIGGSQTSPTQPIQTGIPGG